MLIADGQGIAVALLILAGGHEVNQKVIIKYFHIVDFSLQV